MNIQIGQTYSFTITQDIRQLKIPYIKDERETLVIHIVKSKPIDMYVINYHILWMNSSYDEHKNYLICKNDLIRILRDNNIERL